MKPLAGRRILITRARHQAQALAEALESEGAEVMAIPAIEIVPPDSYAALDRALKNARQYQWLVLTSANGVEALLERLREIAGSTLSSPAEMLDTGEPLKIAAMGPATARVLETHGLPVHVVPEQYVAESLAAALSDQVHGQNVLLVRAKVARDILPRELEKAGARVDVVDAYQTVVPAASAGEMRGIFTGLGPIPHAVTFTSSSTVTNFFRLLAEAGIPGWPAALAAASIGPITSRTLREHGIEPVVEATEFTIPGLVKALGRWYGREI